VAAQCGILLDQELPRSFADAGMQLGKFSFWDAGIDSRQLQKCFPRMRNVMLVSPKQLSKIAQELQSGR
jgi:hypothetical protein